MSTIKCNVCGKQVEISRDGWLVESYQRGKKEVRYTEWHHVVGHWHGKRLCAGSGVSPSEMRANNRLHADVGESARFTGSVNASALSTSQAVA